MNLHRTARPHRFNLWRATPTIATAAAVILLILGVTLAFMAQHEYARQKSREAKVQAQILASAVTAALSFNDRAAAQEYVDALRANPEMLQAAIYDSGGTLFASFSRFADSPPPRRSVNLYSLHENNRLNVIEQVDQAGKSLGLVYLQVITEPPARRYARAGIIALLTTMAALVIGVLGIAHSTLSRTNDSLQTQSAELAAANARLLQQIGERERAEEALRQAQKMEAIGHLTGGVAHDFNNLLQIILSSIAVVRRRGGGWGLKADAGSDFQRYMDAAASAGERAAALTRQLLAFARRQPLEPTRIDVNKLVGGMAELLRRTLGEAIAIENILAAGVWPAFADSNQLASAILNLAVNARDAMPSGGKLRIETANATIDDAYVRAHDDLTPGQFVMIGVTDTGCGMSRDIAAKVFEPFFTTKDVGHGTGLGLSQVYGFVKQSGGHINLYSEPGLGTTVKLYLPRLLTTKVESEDAHPEQLIPRGANTDIVLVVEDEASVRAFSVEMLRELGYSVLEAQNGAEALRIVDARPDIRLLFTDVGLPGGMNGRELADEVRKRRPGMKLLFTSGYTRDAMVHGGRLDEGVALIGKPFTYAALAEKVSQVLTGACG